MVTATPGLILATTLVVLGCVVKAIIAAAPAVAFAVTVTGDSLSPEAAALIVLVPTPLPSVHLPTAATPSFPDVLVPPVRLPPPLAIVNVTGTLLTALPSASLILT